ncbi:hypothetical protein I4U23_031323 [Adineta vaga]|nr:hypothetical protein I4U23_031323 [Adineta vaga]
MRFVKKVFTVWVHFTCVNPVLEEILFPHAQIVSFSNVDNILIEKKQSENEIIFIIISNNEQILCQLDKLEEVRSIFIYSSNNPSHSIEAFQEKFRKVKGIFVDLSLLSRRILLQIKRIEEDFIPITKIIPFSLVFLKQSDLDHLDSSFMYIKLLKDIFIDVKYNQESRKEFIHYYRTQFKQTETAKKMLEEIENYNDRKTLIRQ